MSSIFLSLLVLCNLVLQTTSHSGSDHCWVDDLPGTETARDQARMARILQHPEGARHLQKLSCTEVCDGCITIDVVFHLMVFEVPTDEGTFQLLPHPTSVMVRLDNDDPNIDTDEFTLLEDYKQIIRNNIDVTNDALSGTPFRLNFVEEELDLTARSRYMRRAMDNRVEMTELIGSQDLRVLDIYLVYTLLFDAEFDAGESPLRVGTSSLPSQQLVGNSDGIWLRYDTLTGGGLNPFDLGVTLTHELGKLNLIRLESYMFVFKFSWNSFALSLCC